MYRPFLQITLFAIAAVANNVGADTLACPQPIRTEETLAGAPPQDWQVSVDAAPRYLAGVTFYAGQPSEQASLAPDRDVRAGKLRKASWRFEGSTEPIWFACRYLDSGVTLSKPLPAAYKQCEVSYSAGGIIAAINCQ